MVTEKNDGLRDRQGQRNRGICSAPTRGKSVDDRHDMEGKGVEHGIADDCSIWFLK